MWKAFPATVTNRQSLVYALDALARLTYHNVYVIDYYRKKIPVHVSDNPLFLCGIRIFQQDAGGRPHQAVHIVRFSYPKQE